MSAFDDFRAQIPQLQNSTDYEIANTISQATGRPVSQVLYDYNIPAPNAPGFTTALKGGMYGLAAGAGEAVQDATGYAGLSNWARQGEQQNPNTLTAGSSDALTNFFTNALREPGTTAAQLAGAAIGFFGPAMAVEAITDGAATGLLPRLGMSVEEAGKAAGIAKAAAGVGTLAAPSYGDIRATQRAQGLNAPSDIAKAGVAALGIGALQHAIGAYPALSGGDILPGVAARGSNLLSTMGRTALGNAVQAPIQTYGEAWAENKNLSDPSLAYEAGANAAIAGLTGALLGPMAHLRGRPDIEIPPAEHTPTTETPALETTAQEPPAPETTEQPPIVATPAAEEPVTAKQAQATAEEPAPPAAADQVAEHITQTRDAIKQALQGDYKDQVAKATKTVKQVTTLATKFQGMSSDDLEVFADKSSSPAQRAIAQSLADIRRSTAPDEQSSQAPQEATQAPEASASTDQPATQAQAPNDVTPGVTHDQPEVVQADAAPAQPRVLAADNLFSLKKALGVAAGAPMETVQAEAAHQGYTQLQFGTAANRVTLDLPHTAPIEEAPTTAAQAPTGKAPEEAASQMESKAPGSTITQAADQTRAGTTMEGAGGMGTTMLAEAEAAQQAPAMTDTAWGAKNDDATVQQFTRLVQKSQHQQNYLRALAENPDASDEEIAQAMGLSNGNRRGEVTAAKRGVRAKVAKVGLSPDGFVSALRTMGMELKTPSTEPEGHTEVHALGDEDLAGHEEEGPTYNVVETPGQTRVLEDSATARATREGTAVLKAAGVKTHRGTVKVEDEPVNDPEVEALQRATNEHIIARNAEEDAQRATEETLPKPSPVATARAESMWDELNKDEDEPVDWATVPEDLQRQFTLLTQSWEGKAQGFTDSFYFGKHTELSDAIRKQRTATPGSDRNAQAGVPAAGSGDRATAAGVLRDARGEPDGPARVGARTAQDEVPARGAEPAALQDHAVGDAHDRADEARAAPDLHGGDVDEAVAGAAGSRTRAADPSAAAARASVGEARAAAEDAQGRPSHSLSAADAGEGTDRGEGTGAGHEADQGTEGGVDERLPLQQSTGGTAAGTSALDTGEAAGERINELTRRLARDGRFPGAAAVRPFEARLLPDSVQRIADALGVKVQGFELRPGLTEDQTRTFDTIDGTRLNGALFIRADKNARPHLAILGHELVHDIAATRPDLYAKFVDAVRPYVRQAKYDAEFHAHEVANGVERIPAKLHEEFMGEVMSDAFMDRKFWQALGDKSPTLLGTVVRMARNMIDRVFARMGGYRREVGQYLSDYHKVLEIASGVMSQYHQGIVERAASEDRVPLIFRKSMADALEGVDPHDVVPEGVRIDPARVKDHFAFIDKTAEAVKRRVPDALHTTVDNVSGKVHDFLDGTTVKHTALAFMTARNLDHAYGSKIDGVHDHVQELFDMGATRRQAMQPHVRVTDALMRLPLKTRLQVGRVMEMAKRLQVHPDRALSDKLNAHLTGNEAYNQVRAEWTKLAQMKDGVAAQAVYKQALAANDRINAWVRQAIITKFKEAGLPIPEYVYKERNGPYFASSRDQNAPWALVWKSPELKELGDSTEADALKSDPEHYIVSFFNSKHAGDIAAQRLEAEGKMGAQVMVREKYDRDFSGVPAGFMDKLDSLFKDNKVDPEVAQAAKEIYLKSLPPVQANTRRMSYKGVAGIRPEEMIQGFQNTGLQVSHQIAQLTHTEAMVRALQRVKAADKDKMVYNMLRKRMVMLAKPENFHPLLSKAMNFTFMNMLGANPAFLSMQMAQPWMLALPQLAAKDGVGWRAASAHLAQATADAGKVLNLVMHDQGWRYELGAPEFEKAGFNTNEQALLKSLLDEGLLDITSGHQFGFSDQVMPQSAGWVMKIGTLAPHMIEQLDRMGVGLATYRALTKAGKSHEEAMDAAHDLIDSSMMDYSRENTAYAMMPGHMGGMNRLFMQFRKYQQGVVATFVRQIAGAARGDKEAMKATFGLLATHAMMAGAVGLPVAFPVATLAKLVTLAWPSDDRPDPDEWFKQYLDGALGQEGSLLVRKGLPALLGIDLSQRMGAGDILNPAPYARWTGSASDTFKDFLANAVPVLGATSNAMRGYDYMSEGDMVKGIGMVMPKFVSNFAKAYSLANRGIVNKYGDSVITPDDLHTGDIAATALGFQPSDVERHYEAQAAVGDARTAVTEARDRLISQWVNARSGGDSDVMQQTQAQIAEFNARHQGQQSARITTSNLLQAAQRQRAASRSRIINGVTLRRGEQWLEPYAR